jgi:biopolymer transport protein ExbD
MQAVPQFAMENRMNSRRIEPSDYYSKIDVSALASVLFVLVFAFMALQPFPHPHGMFVDLPKVRHVVPMPKALREDALRIGVQRDGSVYFGTERVYAGELIVKLREGLNSGAEKRVYIQVDERARYRTVESVLDSIGAAGIQNVSFVAEMRR